MTNNIPFNRAARKICIVCEGNEEYEYLKRLIDLHVWNSIYKVELKNAEGNGNIAARYQDGYQNDVYDAVFVFCDTEKKRMSNIRILRGKLMTSMV